MVLVIDARTHVRFVSFVLPCKEPKKRSAVSGDMGCPLSLRREPIRVPTEGTSCRS
jgi:hypothetical protein